MLLPVLETTLYFSFNTSRREVRERERKREGEQREGRRLEREEERGEEVGGMLMLCVECGVTCIRRLNEEVAAL